MKNKKAFLLAEETIKIILAVICIVFLVYLLFSLYNSGRESKEKVFAEESLNKIINSITIKSSELYVFNPEDSIISSWGENLRPASCESVGWRNCLCICKKSFNVKILPFFSYTPDDFAKDCSKWACMQTAEKIEIIPSNSDFGIKISNPPVKIQIEYSETQIKLLRK
jgi:hypothetical protein